MKDKKHTITFNIPVIIGEKDISFLLSEGHGIHPERQIEILSESVLEEIKKKLSVKEVQRELKKIIKKYAK